MIFAHPPILEIREAIEQAERKGVAEAKDPRVQLLRLMESILEKDTIDAFKTVRSPEEAKTAALAIGKSHRATWAAMVDLGRLVSSELGLLTAQPSEMMAPMLDAMLDGVVERLPYLSISARVHFRAVTAFMAKVMRVIPPQFWSALQASLPELGRSSGPAEGGPFALSESHVRIMDEMSPLTQAVFVAGESEVFPKIAANAICARYWQLFSEMMSPDDRSEAIAIAREHELQFLQGQGASRSEAFVILLESGTVNLESDEEEWRRRQAESEDWEDASLSDSELDS